MLLEHAETDWLGSKPVFYNEKTGTISHNINEVIDYTNVQFHPEGLRNYLRFGYSILGQTPIKDVKALRYDSSITKDEEGKLHVEEHDDSLLELYGKNQKTGTEVFEELLEDVRQYAAEETDQIVLPLSSGYDSRLLALACAQDDKDKTNAFSYGASVRQYDSYEALRASMVAQRLGLNWEHVPLGNFYAYIDEWNDLYGICVHTHGMYQMEFYKNIIARMGGCSAASNLSLISGIIGDAWAGNVRIEPVLAHDDLIKMGYTHNMCIEDDTCILGDNSHDIVDEFLALHKNQLKEENWRVIFAMRMKIMLLHYLLKTPSSYGMKVYSPFMNKNLAMDIVNLDWAEKANRKWQTESFEKYGLSIGWEKRKCDYTDGALNIQAFKKNPLKPLNSKLLGQVVKEDYVEYVNKVISKNPMSYIPAKPKTPQSMYNKLVRKNNMEFQKAVNSYMTLLPIQRVIERTENSE